MERLTARQRLIQGSEPVVANLEGEKAARFKAKTMLIPSLSQVRDAIAGIPAGKSKTVKSLREELALAAGVDVTCPWATNVCWKHVAETAERSRAEGRADITPWWRVTQDGKPSPKMPGGVEWHRSLLQAEAPSNPA